MRALRIGDGLILKPVANSKNRVERYLARIAEYLASYRKREGLTQNEMAKRLEISLNRYREYEQNTTDNAKGIPLDLLLRICELENVPPPSFIAELEGSELADVRRLDPIEEEILAQFRQVPLAERKRFVESFSYEDETDKLVPNQIRWFVRIFNQLVRLPYSHRMRIEREVLESYMASAGVEAGSEEHDILLTRLKALLRYYFSNFDDSRRD